MPRCDAYRTNINKTDGHVNLRFEKKKIFVKGRNRPIPIKPYTYKIFIDLDYGGWDKITLSAT